MRSKITSPRTVAADPLAEARSQVADLARQHAEADTNRAKTVSTASDLERQAQAALAAHNELQADDIIAGLQPRPLSREGAELVRRARQVTGSMPTVAEKLDRDLSDLSARLIEAEATFAGEVFAYVRQRQRDAQRAITDALAAIAPELADLLALNEVQRRYCGGERTMRLKPGEAAPWGGDVIVKNFTDRLPLQFKSSPIELLELTRLSADVVKELVAEIEGKGEIP